MVLIKMQSEKNVTVYMQKNRELIKALPDQLMPFIYPAAVDQLKG